MLNKQDCKYGDNCTFAYHQEEIDVWTEERKGTLNRDLLFDPLGGIKQSNLTIAKLLKEHQGIFTFLCEVQSWWGRVGPFSFSSVWIRSIDMSQPVPCTQKGSEQWMQPCRMRVR